MAKTGPQVVRIGQCARAAGALVAALAACVLGSAPGASARPPGPVVAIAAASSTLEVTQVEYRLTLSHTTVAAGRLSLQAIDRGRDPHDLRVRSLSSGQQFAAPRLTAGQHWNGVVYLHPGTYELWCSLPEHARLGMHATLRVLR